MARQHADAFASIDSAAETAGRIAQSVGRTGRLILAGMGGSHCVNRVAAAVLRELAVDAIAMVASDLLYPPMPKSAPKTTVLTSQSGESAEIVRILDQIQGDDVFGLTLNPESRLARELPSLIGAGGPEKGFAATRSLLISLALYAAVAEALGPSQDDARAVLAASPDADISAGVHALKSTTSIIFSGRSALSGMAEAGALGLLELARTPGFALEGGQFRHGPVEVLTHEIGVVLFKCHDAAASLTDDLARVCVEAGTRPVIFDLSGDPDIPGGVTIRLPPLSGLAAALALLPPLQRLLIELAKLRVERVGEPLRSQKVTRTE